MKVRISLCVVCVALTGLLLAADPPNKEAAPVDVNGDGAYAKVELKGRLSVSKSPDAKPPYQVLLNVRNDDYLLDFSERKDLQGEGFEKLNGRTVMVTGNLELNSPRGRVGRGANVLVSSVRVDVAWLEPRR